MILDVHAELLSMSLQHTVAEEVELDMVRGSLRPLQESPIRTFDRGAQPPSNIQTDPSQVRVVGHGAFDEVMGNGIKEGFDVQIDDPVGRPAPFPRRPDRVKRRTARSIAVGVRMEPRLHQRLQDHLDDRLRHAVGNGRNAERPRAAVVLRYLDEPHGRRMIRAPDAIRFQTLYRLPFRSCSNLASDTPSTPAAPRFAFTRRYASQTSCLEM